MLGNTDDETKLAAERARSREIVDEILKFGITDRQLYQIIALLAMNIENFDAMCKISDIVEELTPTDEAWNKLKAASFERMMNSTDQGIITTIEDVT